MTSETMTPAGSWSSEVEAEIRDYVDRGRSHKNLNSEQLQGLFKRIFRNLAHLTSLTTIFIKMHDVQAEYALRHLDPPYNLVKDDAEQFIEQVSCGAAMDSDEQSKA